MFSAANYSTNCVTFDPKGKILQIDYAKEAVKQGSTSLGLKSNSHVVSNRVRKNVLNALGTCLTKFVLGSNRTQEDTP